jgi:hypothetical protein
MDSSFVPVADSHSVAVAALDRLFPDGEERDAKVYNSIRFIDQGELIEMIYCPGCAVATPVDYLQEDDPGASWWDETCDLLNDTPVVELNVQMPCCGKTVPFTSLTFDSPAAFARFELSVHNPNVAGNLSESQLSELERSLGCKLKQVWARY